MRAFIDTDIGSDVDDLIALIYAAKNLELAGITTVHGCARKRAQIAEKVLRAIQKDIPVRAGLDKPLASDTVYVYGHEGKGILEGNEPEPLTGAVEFLEDSVQPGDIIIGIAPLTNIAALLKKKPGISPGRLYLMGGVVEKGGQYAPNREKHNFKADPEAADIVFSSGIPITVLTTDVAKSVWLTPDEFAKLPKEPVFDYARQNAKYYLEARGQDRAYMYDPLTALLAVKPQLFKEETTGNITVITSVDAVKAKEEITAALVETHAKNPCCHKAVKVRA